MELFKENLQLTETRACKKAQTTCDTDMIVPDVKPDILKIVQVDGTAFITSKEIADTSCKVNGKVKYAIFYLPDSSENSIEVIHAEQDFSAKIDLGVSSGILDVTCDVERIDFSLLNSRKLAVKTTVSLPYVIMENKTLSLAGGIDYAQAETICEHLTAESIYAFEECAFMVRDRLELPSGRTAISQILKLDAKVVNPEIKAITGKAVLKGSLQVSALYLDCEGAVNTISGEIPFTEVSEIFELEENSPCRADYRIGDYGCELGFDLSGEATEVNFDISITAVISAYSHTEMLVLTDCFCPGRKTDILYEHLAIENVVSSISHTHSVKEIISPRENSPEIDSVYNIFAKPVIQSATPKKGAVDIDGTLEVYLSCITSSPQQPVYTFKHDIPLHITLEEACSNDACSCLADITVPHISFNLNMANEIELRAALSVSAKLTKRAEFDVVTDCVSSEAAPEAGIIIYFVQPGDSLWSIAKNYSVAIADLTEINGIDTGDTLDVGKKLIIPV